MSSRYSKMKIPELKDQLKKKGLSTTGNRETLLQRLETGGGSGGSGSDEEKEEKEEKEDKDSGDDEDDEEELPSDIKKMKVPDLKAALKKRGLSVGGNKAALVERLQSALGGGGGGGDEASASNKRKANSDDDDTPKTTKKKAKTATQTFVPSTDEDFSTPAKQPNELKIVSWNVAGYNAVLKKGFDAYLKSEDPDILCLNETKIKSVQTYPGYFSYSNSCSSNPGYSGVAVITKVKPLSVTNGIGIEEHDTEGRVITAEYDQFYLVASYIPNSGAKGDDGWPKDLDYRMKWDVAFQNYLHKLDSIKPVVWCGDLNVAHKEIDLAYPSSNKKTAGFTEKERNSFDKFLSSGFVDVHRYFYPNTKGCYTFWSYRSPTARKNNTGWRLDYFVVSTRFLQSVKQSYIRAAVEGSDHCPICIHVERQ